MRLGTTAAHTFIISSRAELRRRAKSVSGDVAAILTDTYRCDVPIQPGVVWEIADYRAQAQLAFLHELYDLLPDGTSEAVFGKRGLTINDVERYWRVELLRIDEFTDFNELYRADAKRLRRLPRTGRRRVDAWLSDLQAAARANALNGNGVRDLVKSARRSECQACAGEFPREPPKSDTVGLSVGARFAESMSLPDGDTATSF